MGTSGTVPWNEIGQHDGISQAIREVYDTHGDTISVVDKKKTLIKFGRRNDIDSGNTYEIMELPSGIYVESLATGNSIDALSTSDTGNSGQTVRIEYHTIADGNLTFGVQFAETDGQSEVLLDVPCARVSRVTLSTGEALAASSSLYIYDRTGVTLESGVPDIDANVHMIVSATYNRSQKMATSISSVDYWIVKWIMATIGKQTSGVAEVEFQIASIGGAFYSAFNPIALHTQGVNSLVVPIDPYLIVPKNTDVRAVASSTVNNVSVSASMGGYLASVVG